MPGHGLELELGSRAGFLAHRPLAAPPEASNTGGNPGGSGGSGGTEPAGKVASEKDSSAQDTGKNSGGQGATAAGG